MVSRECTYIAVVGSNNCSRSEYERAVEVGRLVARERAILVCGGRQGVMEAVCKGAKEEGGVTVGILPGLDRRDANPYVDVCVLTGMGPARNAIVVSSADVVIAVSGGYGTLSEVALALKAGIPVVGLGTWEFVSAGGGGDPLLRAADPAEAVKVALDALTSRLQR